MNHFQLLYLQKNNNICKSSFRRNRTDTRGAGGLSRVTWGRQQGGQGRTLWQRRTFCHHSRSQVSLIFIARTKRTIRFDDICNRKSQKFS